MPVITWLAEHKELVAGCFAAGVLTWTAIVLHAASSAMYYRPLPDHSKDGRSIEFARLRELPAGTAPFGLLISRWAVQVVVSVFMKLAILARNQLEISNVANYRTWLQFIARRPPGVPLITVSNHVSSLDDPGLVACLCPWSTVLNPYRMRWSIATQEIVYPPVPWIQAFMGSGKVLPIWRGGGIDQPLFWDFGRQVAAGGWAHVFPEARVVQSGLLGRDAITKRTEEEQLEKGLLKWGVGKLIAHSPCPPVVIPFHHYGMAAILPQHNRWEGDNYNNNVVTWKRLGTGHKIKVWWGDRLTFDDLISEHEKEHGPLWKISTDACNEENWQIAMAKFKSREEDKPLYSAITRRIEEALLKLQNQATQDLKIVPDLKIRAWCPRSRQAMAHKNSRTPPPE